jgi:hypothetical protein
MGLYLCIFQDEEELDGVEVGPYADFNELRNYVVSELEDGMAGSKFPTFILHSDSDGEWSLEDCISLDSEISVIISSMKGRPPVPFVSEWQLRIARSIGLEPKNAFESFVDVDGEFLLDRLKNLITLAIRSGLPILFQ